MGEHLLTSFVALPFAAAALIAFIPRASQTAHRFVAGTTTAAAFAFLIGLVLGDFDASRGGLQFVIGEQLQAAGGAGKHRQRGAMNELTS